MRSGRLTYRGQAYRLVSRADAQRSQYGAEVYSNGHEETLALLRKIASDPANLAVLRRDLPALSHNVTNVDSLLADASNMSVEGIGPLTLMQELLPLLAPCSVTVDGDLTLSDVSWGETAGVYPSNRNLYSPDRWDVNKLCQLLKARAAIHDVARRNSRVHRNTVFKNQVERRLRPYHCTENFPTLDQEIDQDVSWFYLSAQANAPAAHPGLSQGSEIAKSYGPFYTVGGGDAGRGTVYIHFYRLS